MLKALDANHPDVARIYNNIGVVYKDKGDFDKALDYYQRSLSIRLKSLGANHPDVATSYVNFGSFYAEVGEINKAIEFSNKSLAIYLNVFGSYHPLVGNNYNLFANIYSRQAEHPPPSLLNTPPASPDTVVPPYRAGLNRGDRGDLYLKALKYIQKAIQSIVKGFEYSSIYVNPKLPTIYQIKEGRSTINSMPYLLDALESKAGVLEKKWEGGKK